MSPLEQTDWLVFGVFEVDLKAGELWRNGHKVRLTGQPFKVLVTLLGRPGEVISRDELQEEVWGANTTIDFERAIAGAINKVREALGDSAENPRFVQTLPKRGYRFVAPVMMSHPLSEVAAQATQKDGMQVAPSSELIPADLTLTETPLAAPGSQPPGQGHLKQFFSLQDGSIQDGRILDGSIQHRSIQRWKFVAAATTVLSLLLVCLTLRTNYLSGDSAELAPLRIDQLTHNGAISTGPPNPENLLTMATDGNRILTSVMQDGRARLSAISISTGEIQQLALPQELSSGSLADIAKDGSKLLLKSHPSSSSEQPFWIVPSSGGSALRVGGVLAHDAAWMPDGKSVLYASEDDLSIISLASGVSVPFAHLNGRAFWMRWSPDSKLLRFTLIDPVRHTSGIWELSAEGGAPQRVHTPQEDKQAACCGTWLADGSAYILQSGEDLWQMKGSSRGAGLVQLTNGPLRFSSPVAARTGSRIMFLGLNSPLGMQYATDGKFVPVPSFLAQANRVDYSRDGLWVAWTDNNEKLWRARASDGSEKVQLTPDYLEIFMARWSPDGSQLAIMARERGKVWRMYLVDAAGGKLEPLLDEDRNAADPGWSADGSSLVFGREPDLMGKESGLREILILNLATKQTEILPGSEGMFSPRWSPDGRWIAALSLDQKNLMLFDVVQRKWKELARTSAADPNWSVDSKSIYVQAFLEDKQPILKISVADGSKRVVADLSGFRDRDTINFFFGGLTTSGQPLAEPRIGAGDLYTLDLRVR